MPSGVTLYNPKTTTSSKRCEFAQPQNHRFFKAKIICHSDSSTIQILKATWYKLSRKQARSQHSFSHDWAIYDSAACLTPPQAQPGQLSPARQSVPGRRRGPGWSPGAGSRAACRPPSFCRCPRLVWAPEPAPAPPPTPPVGRRRGGALVLQRCRTHGTPNCYLAKNTAASGVYIFCGYNFWQYLHLCLFQVYVQRTWMSAVNYDMSKFR